MEIDLCDLPTRQMLLDIADQVPGMDVRDIETYLMLFRTAADLFKRSSTNLAKWNISPAKMMILMRLFKRREGVSPSELAERMGVTRGTITGLLHGLERDGLIERNENRSDRRMMNITLTQQGVQFINDMLPGHLQLISEVMSVLAEEEQTTLIMILQKIRTQIAVLDRH